jgi:penicillin amidase
MTFKRKIPNIIILAVCLALIFLIVTSPILNTLMTLLNPVTGIYSSANPLIQNQYLIKGLKEEVKIIIDSRGVPHIYANNDKDLFFAIGFMHAKDRLWQMDIQRRAAEGRLAEIIGKSALKNDIIMRTIGLWRAAIITANYIKENYLQYWELYQAYADGVNAYIDIAVKNNNLPLMFRLLDYKPDYWSVADSIAFAKLMSWSLTNFYEPLKFSLVAAKLGSREALKIYPIFPHFQENVTVIPGNGTIEGKKINVDPDYLLSLDWYSEWATGLNFSDPNFSNKLIEAINDALNFLGEDPEYLGSNNWAVSASKSSNGYAMLADDPHLGLQIPSLWYEVDLHSKDINCYGVTLAGIPPIIIGFNNKIAWGLTNTQMSVMDFYIEKINPQDPSMYYYNGSWHKIQTVRETINVKGEKPYELLVNTTVHGPIITSKGLAISIKWVGMNVTLEAIAIIDVMKANNLSEFFNALKHWDVPSQNFMYADVYGNIAVIEPGKFPLRLVKLPNNQTIYVLGSRSVLNGTGGYEWSKFIPFELLPHSINPSQGYLAAPNQMSVNKYYPFFILGGWWDPGSRAHRINVILNKTKVSLEDMMEGQRDVFQWDAYSYSSLIIKSMNMYPSSDPDVQKALNLLKNWNFTMKKDMEAPSVWWFWVASFYNMTFIKKFKELGIERAKLPYLENILYLALNEPNSTWFNGNFYLTASQALVNAVKYLKNKYGNDWTWGKIHRVYFKHLSGLEALSLGPYEEDGGDDTLMAAGMPLFGGFVTHGPSWRMIVVMSQKPQGYGVYPGGQSENPVSNHYGDFVDYWLSYKYYKLNLANSPSEVTDATLTITLSPA